MMETCTGCQVVYVRYVLHYVLCRHAPYVGRAQVVRFWPE